MFNISQYLEKFKNIGQGERQIKEVIVLCIKNIVGIEIEGKNIIIKNGEVIIKASPAIKNAIYIKKEDILQRLKEKGIENVGDIR